MNDHDHLSATARKLAHKVDQLIDSAVHLEREFESTIAAAHPAYRQSVRNLVHYLALRQTDLRELQLALAGIGLSSLGRFEPCVLATLETVSGVLHRLAGIADKEAHREVPVAITEGPEILRAHSDAVFGPPPSGRHARIMVTMPTQAATDPDLVSDLVGAGMDIARINTAHDDLDAWLRMIENIRTASREHNRRIEIEADLAGPKLRTGPLQAGPRVQRYRPLRGLRGEIVAPLRVWLVPSKTDEPAQELPLDPELLGRIRAGDLLSIWDARGRWRRFPVAAESAGSFTIDIDRTTYAETGARAFIERSGQSAAEGYVGRLPALELPLRLYVGDTLVLTREPAAGLGARRDREESTMAPARIACVPGRGLDNLRAGQTVWFDDGRIGGRVTGVDTDGATIEITHTAARGSNLRSGKGINLPETDLSMSAMSDSDLAALESVVDHVDLIGLSFVRRASDVELLQEHLRRLGAADKGIVLKIETRQGFANLPQLLLAATRSPQVAVMVARGDLAVEVGFQRLAEVQEEILWLCEAAHVPVVWATEVLDTMARTGAPSRAEVTDAAMSERAECVMLNKGPYIVSAVSMLADVLSRMEAHQYKKRSMLRRLAVSEQLAARASANLR